MSTNSDIRAFIDGLIACDEQPSDDRWTELRKAMENKVVKMRRNGRRSLYVFFAGVVVMMLGFTIILLSDHGHQFIWLTRTGFGIVLSGAFVVVIGAVGLLRFRGFGYVWAMHDLHDAAILDLSLQVERLSQRFDAAEKATSSGA